MTDGPFFRSAIAIETATGNTERFAPERHVVPAYDGQDMTALGALLRPDRLPDTMDLTFGTIDDGYLLIWPGQDGVLFDHDFRILGETVNFCGSVDLPPPDAIRRKALRLDHDMMTSIDSVWRNFFHLLVLAVPRMSAGAVACPGVPMAVPDYTTHLASGWPLSFSERTWRQALGIVKAEPILMPPGAFSARRIHTVVLGNREPAYLPCMKHFDSAFAHIREGLRPEKTSPKRIFVRRTDTERLTPAEEEVVLDLCRARWFEPVYLDQLDLLEQAELFAGADVVVAAHGAGLANIVFGRPSLRVLELNRPLAREAWLRPWFYMIARAREQRYAFLDVSLGINGERLSQALNRLMKA